MMNKFLMTLVNLLEIAVGITLLFIGVSGTFTYFLFNALVSVMGFLVAADGLSRIDDPNRGNGNNNQGGNSGRPPEGGGHHRTDGPRENVNNTPTRPSGPINRFGTEEPDSDED